MGGFASGFRAGYGLVNDTYEGVRREQQDAAQAQYNQDRLSAEQARLQQDSRYNSERLRLQGESNRQGADYNQRRLEVEGEYNRDRLAELAEQTRIAENQFQVKSALDAATLASKIREEASGISRDRAYVDYYTAGAEGQRLENIPVMQREATRTAVNELQNSGTLSVSTLRGLQGTGLNAAKFLAPDAPIQLGNAYAFATGRRTDYDSAEFAGALNWLFESDTAAMIGQTPEGRNGAIVKQTIVGMEPVKGRDDAFKLVVQNQLDTGEVYSSYVTQGRRAGAPAAEMTMEAIGQKLDANSAAAEAFNRPELAARLLSQYAQLDPQLAIDAAAMRQEDINNAQPLRSQEEYLRTAVGMKFGRITPVALFGAPPPQNQPQQPPQDLAQTRRDPSQRPGIGEALAPIGDFLFGNNGNAPGVRGNAGGLNANDLAALNSNRAQAAPPSPSQDPGTAAVNSVLGSPAPTPQSNQPPSIGEIRRAIMMQFRGSDRFVSDLTDEEVLEYYRSGQVTL